MRTFRLHVLPVILALLIIVLGGGFMFLAMRFGFGFQDRVIIRNSPDAGILYSEKTPLKLADFCMWESFESSSKKSFANGLSPDETGDEAYAILSRTEETASLISRSYLGRLTADERDVSIDLSSARYAVMKMNASLWFNEEYHDLYAVAVDNCIVSFDTEGEKFKLRYMYNCVGELISFEFENIAEKEYTVDEVNNEYRNIQYELRSLNMNSNDTYDPYTLLFDPTAVYRLASMYTAADVEYEYDDPSLYETVRFPRPVSYFLTMYGLLYDPDEKSYTEYAKYNMSVYINANTGEAVYSDGCIYISFADVNGKGGLVLKYSVAEKCITGMAIT